MTAMTEPVRPDFYSSRKMTQDALTNRALFEEMAKELKRDATWLRFTIDESHSLLWVEGWKERPKQEAAFDPPYTAEQARSDRGSSK